LLRLQPPGTAPDAHDDRLALVVTVRFADGRFHGDEWPPSPARLFQAIVGGTGASGPLTETASEALRWLELLSAPLIIAPHAKPGSTVRFFVPRNDQDALQSNPLNNEAIRYPKDMRPQLFDEGTPLLYVWTFAREDQAKASEVCALAENVFRLGHGVDIAWASGEVVKPNDLARRIERHTGRVYKPTGGTHGLKLACPTQGSLQSVIHRHEAGLQPFRREKGILVRTQPPPPRFRHTIYNHPPVHRLYEMRAGNGFAAWPAERVSELASALRDASSRRLAAGLPNQSNQVERAFPSHPLTMASSSSPVRILPLPSIGHRYADGAIRRVLVDVPPACPLGPEDVFWAFSGLDLGDKLTLTPTRNGDRMLSHYGLDGTKHKTWQTVTPAVLPESVGRRRIDRTRKHEEAKSATERAGEEMRAAAAVLHDLRAVQFLPQLDAIRVQREPFEGVGPRAEAFARGSEAHKERLWHVKVTFMEPVEGPLVVGDGQLVGLGLMAPVRGQ